MPQLSVEQLVKRMKKITVKDKEAECPICWETFGSTQKAVELSCNAKHFFHEKCIIRHQTYNPEAGCPLCREKIKIA